MESGRLDSMEKRLARVETALLAAAEQLRMQRCPLPPRCLSVAEACQVLGLSRGTVHAKIQAGELRAASFRMGKRVIYRIQSDDLQRFIDAAKAGEREPVIAGRVAPAEERPTLIRVPV